MFELPFLDRQAELRRLDAALAHPGSFTAIWGRRRVGKTRLLLEWASRRDGLYTVAGRSAASVQRRYAARAVARRVPGFAEVEYPDWDSFLARLGRSAARRGWRGPWIVDEFPHLIAADPSFETTLQAWLDAPGQRPALVAAGSSIRMMHGAVLDGAAPLYGRAREAFPIAPLAPAWIRDAVPGLSPWEQVAFFAIWGGIPRYWELARGFGSDFEAAMDALVLDPRGPLHREPDRLLQQDLPPATALRPVLDAIGAGAHRVSEIAARLGRPASALSRPISTLQELELVSREIPFGSPARSGKRSLYRLADPFLRLWFGVVAPNEALLAAAPSTTRLTAWRGRRTRLEAVTWEEMCRRAVPRLHETGNPVGELGPWEPARRYWRGNEPEVDIAAWSIDRSRLLLGEAKWSSGGGRSLRRWRTADLPRGLPAGACRAEIVRAVFSPEPPPGGGGDRHVDAAAVLAASRGGPYAA